MSEFYTEPVIAPIDSAVVGQVSEKLGLEIPDGELREYVDSVNKVLASASTISRIPPPKPKVTFPRTPGYRPSKEENPYNAWFIKTDIKGAPSGGLAGKRIAVKDCIAVAGVQMTNGSQLLEGHVPDYDATVVTRILEAGGTIAGKSTCENLCAAANSFTSFYGPVLNPIDPKRSAGGSSSGSAVLVATGEADMSLGTDLGGSMRVPASWCGVVGLKPTHGLVPYTGAIGIYSPMDHLGLMAKTVEDAAKLLQNLNLTIQLHPASVITQLTLLLERQTVSHCDPLIVYQIMAGPDDLDARQYPWQPAPKVYLDEMQKGASGLKIGILQEGLDASQENIRDCVVMATEKLALKGCEVKQVSVPWHSKVGEVFPHVATPGCYDSFEKGGIVVGSGSWHDVGLAQRMQSALNSQRRDLIRSMKLTCVLGEVLKNKDNYRTFAKAENIIPVIRSAYNDVLKDCDVFILPTVPYTAPLLPPNDIQMPLQEYMDTVLGMTTNTSPFNITGHPSLTVPVGQDQADLPIGAMIVGKHFQEDVIFRVAQALESRQ